jgi:hypothetical protein
VVEYREDGRDRDCGRRDGDCGCREKNKGLVSVGSSYSSASSPRLGNARCLFDGEGPWSRSGCDLLLSTHDPTTTNKHLPANKGPVIPAETSFPAHSNTKPTEARRQSIRLPAESPNGSVASRAASSITTGKTACCPPSSEGR